ncbi:hypothetical protein DOY81_002394, partial [Sarcophaga bullata]
IQQRRTYYGSLDDTVITIEADESTPLLVDRSIVADSNNNRGNNHNNNKKINVRNAKWKYGVPSWPNDSDCSEYSSKTFKSHFTEIRVLAFALFLAITLCIAIYLLAIETRLPSITFTLDLVGHDIWSRKYILRKNRLQHDNVDHIILMQTGNRNCDTTGECLKVLEEMENKNSEQWEELPYNFLIGGDGQAYEVRGWEYSSSIIAVPQERSLVIGIIGNFDYSTPSKILLQTAFSLIQESSKRRKINRKYYIYGLHSDLNDGQLLFKEVMKWPQFKGFLSEF